MVCFGLEVFFNVSMVEDSEIGQSLVMVMVMVNVKAELLQLQKHSRAEVASSLATCSFLIELACLLCLKPQRD